jgi:hypothetical protein
LHPGLIFLSAPESLMDQDSQALMFEHALDKVEEEEPINEAITVELFEDEDSLVVEIDRFDLPSPEIRDKAA